MKKLIYVFLLLLTVTACKDKKETAVPTEEPQPELSQNTTPTYPETLVKVFNAHGGLDVWNDMRTLEFTMEKPDGNEITTTDLKERYSLIEMPKSMIGFDGEHVWTKSNDGSKLDKDPKFYYNLMFYFYAMPFIVADNGIIYDEYKPLQFEGKEYPGIRISYQSGVGESPEDEYVLYYDKDTYQMTWLAYTVTYFSKEKSKKWSFIKYNDWREIEGLLLPAAMTWYNVEDNQPVSIRKEELFNYVSLSRDKMNLKMYMMPEGAEEVQ